MRPLGAAHAVAGSGPEDATLPSKADTPAYRKLCTQLEKVETHLADCNLPEIDGPNKGSCPPIDWPKMVEHLKAATSVANTAAYGEWAK